MRNSHEKKLLWIFLSLFIIVSSYCIYQESHFPGFVVVPANMTEAQILKEMPDIAISDADEALRQAVLDLPQIQSNLREIAAGNSLDSDSIPFSTVQAQLEPHLPKGWTKMKELAASEGGNAVYLSLEYSPEKTVYYQFSADGSYQTCKTIGIYHKNRKGDLKSTVVYSNDGSAIQKLVEKRIWFAWLNQDD